MEELTAPRRIRRPTSVGAHLTQDGASRARALAPSAVPELSIVAPFHDEVESLERFVLELERELAEADVELIAVDDGSTDGSFDLLERLAATRRWIRIIRLPINRGQTAAMAVGIEAARAPVIVTTDSDGQNDPRDIAHLVERLRSSRAAAVVGRRVDRKEGVGRRVVSAAANTFIRRGLRVPVHDTGCTLKAFRAEAIKDVSLLRDDHRFLPVFIAMRGAPVVEVPVRDRPRIGGTSHYGFSRIFGVAADLFGLWIAVRFRGRPVRAAGWVATIISTLWLLVGALLAASAQIGLAAGAWSIGITVALLTFVVGAFAEQYIRFRGSGYPVADTDHRTVPFR